MVQKSILVVDDVADWREQLKSILKRSGYQVDTAANYRQALVKINHTLAELVIVDLRLDPVDENNRDGMLLLEQLSKLRINALVITGYGTADLKEKAQTLEAISFIEKGVIGKSLEKLKTIINTIFSEIEARDRNRAEVRQKFIQGEAVGFSSSAAGYPLRESLDETIEQVINGSP
ncbi:MAG: response regulator [Anaerolineae bacterium]